MTITELLAEQVRLGAAWDAAQAEVLTAARRYRRDRNAERLASWDASLAAQEALVEQIRDNSRALRLAAESGGRLAGDAPEST